MNKRYGKIISVFLSIALIFAFSSVCAYALNAKGSGTEADPYLITTASELKGFGEAVADGDDFADKYIVLNSDITVDDTFLPIGTKNAPFSGIFNGNGHTVSGISFDCDYAGFFAYTKNAVISDLTVSGNIFAIDYAGGIAAYADNTVIENCISDTYIYADNYAGGIAGYIKSGKISDCSTTSTLTIIGYEEYVGGIAGSSGADIENCTNNAYVQGAKNTGGIAGTSSADILYCTNTVRVEASANNCGAIAGYTSGSVKYCKNTGGIIGSGKTGGIVGVGSNAEIAECLQQGSVTASDEYAGGIAGYLTGGKLSDCICTADVYSSSDFAAGIFGSASSTEIARCLFTASATARNSTDAAIGALVSGNVNSCYFDNSKESKAFAAGTAPAGAYGLNASEMVTASSYSGWDFNKVWDINEVHASYPLLRNIGFHTLSFVSETKATCTENGIRTEICSLCAETIVTETEAFGHDYKIVSLKYASCMAPGYTDRVCNTCGDAVSETVEALPHTDADGNKICDECEKDLNAKQDTEKEKNLFEKIADFFKKIIDWFRSLFK